MDERLKAGILALVAGAVIFSQSGDQLSLCGRDGRCRAVSTVEYKELKTSLAGKLEKREEFTFDEYETLTAVLDREVKGGVTFTNIVSSDDLRQRLAQKLYE
jgi:hypothetical protein